MTLRRGRDGKPVVRTDPGGQRYAECDGVVKGLAALQGAPLSVQEEWGSQVRCGQPVALPSNLAGDPDTEMACPDCQVTPGGPPPEMQLPCSAHEQGCRIVLTRDNCVAYSRRGVSLHRCRDGHFSFATFR